MGSHRLHGAKVSFRLVKDPQFPFSDREVTAEHNQRSLLFAFRHERKCPEVRHALADRRFLEQPVRFGARAVLLSDSLCTLVDLAHPAIDKSAFTDSSIVEAAGQNGRYAAAFLVTHDHDLGNIELGHAIFDGCGDSVARSVRFEGRRKIGDVPNDEDVAWVGIENGRGIGTAVATGDDHCTRGLPLGQLLPFSSAGLD